MALQLNVPTQVYKEFYGRNVDQMPKLIAEGRVPLSVNGLMKRRLEVEKLPFEDLKDAYWNNYFNTGDAVARHSDGRVKIVLDSKDLRGLNPKSKLLNGGGLILTNEVYEVLDGPEFSPKDIERYTGKSLSKSEVNKNPMWQSLARDKAVLRAYTDKTFEKAKAQFGYDQNVGLYLPSVQEKPIMRSWCVRRLDYGSYAFGYGSLDDAYGRLVGVAPEALVAQKNLETRVKR